MKRRLLLLFVVALIMVVVVAMALQPKPTLLVLDWANKAPKETPPVAILVEVGTGPERRGSGPLRAAVVEIRLRRSLGREARAWGTWLCKQVSLLPDVPVFLTERRATGN